MQASQERIVYLFNRHFEGSSSPEERQEFYNYINQAEQDLDILELMNQAWQQYIPHGEVPENWSAAVLDQIIGKTKPTNIAPVHRVHLLRRAWFRYAAAVILLLGTTIAIVLTYNRPSGSQTVVNRDEKIQTDIAPGGNKAVLTLADGTSILLDSAADGNLAQQGNTNIIKRTNGQLAYEYGTGSGRPDLSKLLFNTIRTPRGGQYQIMLPDGTKVWLNAASSIRFPAAFVGEKREVETTGEVYMEVVKNSRQPFVVHTNHTTVEVLGTHFNINAYEDESAIKTTLVEGSLKVSNGSATAVGSHVQSVIIKPGQRAVVTAGIAVQAADVEQTLAWKNGLFNLNGLDVRAVMRLLSRWYDVTIRYEGEMPSGNNTFKGEMYRDARLSVVLEWLRNSGIECKMDGKTIIVKPAS